MRRDDNTRFRITLWPSEPLPHPPFQDRVRFFLHDEGLILPDWDAGLSPPSPTASDEMYLELAALDLEDPTAIMGWVERYGGPLGIRHSRVTGSNGIAGFYMIEGADEIAEELAGEHLRVAEAAGVRPGEGETLDEFRWGALCIRDLVSAWRAVQGELDHRRHVWEAPVWAINHDSQTESHPWDDEDGPAALLEMGLGFSLESFTPTIIRTDVPIFNDVFNYEICCLELFNHMVENASYRLCANEPCGRLFVRQRGRAEHGQHRTSGVKYCSAECARAQAQRQYRRRRRASS